MSEPAPGSLVGGRYRLVRRLGAGSMGTVWVASDAGRDVALKLLAADALASPVAVTRFEREVAAAKRLRSPHVIEVYDHGMFGASPFIAMELLEGEDLLARLKRVERLSLTEAAKVAAQIAAGLSPLHEAGVIHRDLKPANVFLARRGSDEIVKLIDFGIARFINAGDGPGGPTTQTGTVLGSPHYMSPEQAHGRKDLDPRADLWAFGAILYRAVTGKLPFPGRDITEILLAICAEDPKPPSTLGPDLGPEVDRFFAKALARDPNARFQTAFELSQAFSALAGPTALPAPQAVTAVMSPNPPSAPRPQALTAPLPRSSAAAPAHAHHGYYAAPQAPPPAPRTSTGAWLIAGVGALTVVVVVVAIVLALAFMWGSNG